MVAFEASGFCLFFTSLQFPCSGCLHLRVPETHECGCKQFFAQAGKRTSAAEKEARASSLPEPPAPGKTKQTSDAVIQKARCRTENWQFGSDLEAGPSLTDTGFHLGEMQCLQLTTRAWIQERIAPVGPRTVFVTLQSLGPRDTTLLELPVEYWGTQDPPSAVAGSVRLGA